MARACMNINTKYIQDTVSSMARACMNIKTKYGISLDTDDCALTRFAIFCTMIEGF